MIHVEQENLNSLAFNDVPITEMILDEENKILKVFFRGARIFDPSIPIFSNRIDMWLGKGVLVFSNWKSIQIHQLYEEDSPRLIKNSEAEQLDDLLTYEFGNELVKFMGQGKKIGFFEEWTIEGANYHGEFEEFDLDRY